MTYRYPGFYILFGPMPFPNFRMDEKEQTQKKNP